MSKVELYEAIRKDHEQGLRAIQALAKKHGCHRREVRRALLSALPPAPKVPVRERPVMGPWVVEIDAILKADRKAPRKQRHTARRIWVRLRKEHEAKVAESTVREYVRERRREIFAIPEAMVPQHHEPGKAADVDLQESWVGFPWGEEKVNFFEMRARCSGAPFHWPLQRATQQAFLEAHNRAFAHYGGGFEKVWYDNLTLAVRKVLKGRTRLETENFKLLRSHYLFDSEFCIPGIRGAHEKGGVEGECGYFRRNHLVPVPRVSGWAELEQLCLEAAEEELNRHMDGHERTVGEEWEEEREHLRALPAEAMDFGLRARCRVDEKSRVNVSCNRYSVPVELVGRWLVAVSSSTEVVVENQGKEVARHQRVYGRGQDRLLLDHYLDVLRYKPGALAGSVPLRQAKADGSFPPSYQELLNELQRRFGESDGARQMVDVLLLHRRFGTPMVFTAVDRALDSGAVSYDAVALMVHDLAAPRIRPSEAPKLTVLVNPELPVPDCRQYDQLMEGK